MERIVEREWQVMLLVSQQAQASQPDGVHQSSSDQARRRRRRLLTVSTPALHSPRADEALVRAQARELAALAAEHGIHDLRFASPGRLLGRVDLDRDALDMAEFAAAAEELLGAEVSLLSDAVLGKPNVSADLLHARAL